MRFEVTLEEMKQLRSLVHQHSGWSIDGKALTKKIDDYITQLEEYNERRKFREPCRFGGFCRDESLYEDCVKDERMKNNWMCWRDGILEKDLGPKPLKSSYPKEKGK